MQKKATGIIVAIIIVIGASAAYLLLRGDATKAPVAQNSQNGSDAPAAANESSSSSPQAAGAYVAYSEEKLAATDGTKILFFHASWCPQCRALEADIQAGRIPEGVTIFKVDYDTNQALRQKYGVTIQTTLVRVDDNGEKVKLFVAYDEPSLRAVTENLL